MSDRWTFSQVEKTGSTNDLARELPLWSAIRASQQTAGRGRRGNHWHSSQGGLWASYVIPSFKHALPSVAIGATIACQLRETFEIKAIRLKFPNDLYIADAKLGGILVEAPDPTRWIIGIGINVNNALPESSQLDYPTTSLSRETQSPNHIELDDLFKKIASWLELPPASPSTNAAAWGDEPKQVLISTHNEKLSGLFLGMTPCGKIIIKVTNGQFKEIPAIHIENFQELPPA